MSKFIKYDIGHIFPHFLLEDPVGYAMAKAIEAALDYFLETVQGGIDTLLNVDVMPEWRLDELGWEYGLVYDYYADIDTKREWIRDAVELSRLIGTKAGVEKYLKARFDDASVKEWWEYDGGLPYHFWVIVAGTLSDENNEWCRRVLEKVKNVRSVVDGVRFDGATVPTTMLTGSAVTGQTTSDYVPMINELYGLNVGKIEQQYVYNVERRDVRKLQE